MEPITIKVKNFYGDAWVNVVVVSPDNFYVMDKIYKTKKDAVKDFPCMVDKKNKKTVKVWLVEAL